MGSLKFKNDFGEAKQVFGSQGSFLVDFYHVCDYLAAVAPSCCKETRNWMRTQKQWLQSGKAYESHRYIERLFGTFLSTLNSNVRKIAYVIPDF